MDGAIRPGRDTRAASADCLSRFPPAAPAFAAGWLYQISASKDRPCLRQPTSLLQRLTMRI